MEGLRETGLLFRHCESDSPVGFSRLENETGNASFLKVSKLELLKMTFTLSYGLAGRKD